MQHALVWYGSPRLQVTRSSTPKACTRSPRYRHHFADPQTKCMGLKRHDTSCSLFSAGAIKVGLENMSGPCKPSTSSLSRGRPGFLVPRLGCSIKSVAIARTVMEHFWQRYTLDRVVKHARCACNQAGCLGYRSSCIREFCEAPNRSAIQRPRLGLKVTTAGRLFLLPPRSHHRYERCNHTRGDSLSLASSDSRQRGQTRFAFCDGCYGTSSTISKTSNHQH